MLEYHKLFFFFNKYTTANLPPWLLFLDCDRQHMWLPPCLALQAGLHSLPNKVPLSHKVKHVFWHLLKGGSLGLCRQEQYRYPQLHWEVFQRPPGRLLTLQGLSIRQVVLPCHLTWPHHRVHQDYPLAILPGGKIKENIRINKEKWARYSRTETKWCHARVTPRSAARSYRQRSSNRYKTVFSGVEPKIARIVMLVELTHSPWISRRLSRSGRPRRHPEGTPTPSISQKLFSSTEACFGTATCGGEKMLLVHNKRRHQKYNFT